LDRGHTRYQQSGVETTTQLVVGRIGSRRFALPIACVERVLAMAAVTRIVDVPPTVAGLLDLHGDTLAVEASTFQALQTDAAATGAPFITHVDGQLVPVLSPTAFNPGRIVQAALGR
jgi:hypothetical protein